MSGDVQPRKRKDKKRKKDDLGIEEPRGTAAALGEGDIFIHSYHDHGTGGHWCAKIIFFSLLAVLITLIGLIILENRGLSELEANAVESRYSGVLEGWIEDAPDDDHHDEHTLELKHHGHLDDDEQDVGGHPQDEDDDENSEQLDDDEDNLQDDDEDIYQQEDDEDSQQDDDDDINQQNDDEELSQEDDDEAGQQDGDEASQENNKEVNEDEVEEQEYRKHLYHDESAYNLNDGNGENKEEQDEDEQQNYQSYGNNEDDEVYENTDEDDEQTNLNEDNNDEQNDDYAVSSENKDDDEHDEGDADDEQGSEEVEKLEHEDPDEEPISTELPALPEKEDDDDDEDNNDDNKDENEDSIENQAEENDDNDVDDDNDDEFLEQDDDDGGPPVEKITAPSGQPFDEIEEVVSSERPPNTLDDEEEYEKKQEEIRREEEQKSSQIWLKLLVGGALLVATQAVVRRATTPRDESEENEEETAEVESPSVIDRRMTLLLDEPPVQEIQKKTSLETSKPIPQDILKKAPLIIKSAPTPKPSVDEEEEEIPVSKTDDKELYSDEEIEEEEENIIIPAKATAKQAAPAKETTAQPKPAETDPDDEDVEEIEIIDEEQLEEEEEEDEDEEEISDVDDVELLTRLEEKYGRLPEPERPGARHKDGGNSMEDYWPSEPSDPFWHQQLDEAERDLLRGRLESALSAASAAELKSSARARWVIAQSLDKMAEAKRDNRILTQSINAYLEVLKMNQNMPDKKLIEVAKRTINRIQFRGTYLSAEPVYRLLIRRFPDQVDYRNNLTVTFLMAGRADLAEEVLKETLTLWPKDRVALAHLGFVLKTEHNKLEEAVELFKTALEGDTGPACEPRFYFHYGDALLLLGRFAEAHDVHKRGAAHGHFLSPEQRSLYNVDRLKSRPWWDIEKQTPYGNLARALEKSWKEILKEGEALKTLYEQEKEGLRERGEWSQLDLFVRGQEIPGRCKQAPVTCSIVKSEVAAIRCRRGQIKFSSMEPGTHVRPHVGPTNCRLRMHLGLKNTKDTYLRVHKETRQWREGRVLLFDDSFEHEVWHNGTGTRLVLIIDVWHPDLTAAERRQLPAI